MADGIYNKCKSGIVNGSYILGTGATGRIPIYVALLNNSYSPNPDSDYLGQFIGTYQIAGTNYVAGGLAVSSPNIAEDDIGDQGVLYGTNIVWDNGTFTARYAVLYGSSGAGVGSDPLICWFDFTTDKAVTAGTFTMKWNNGAAGGAILSCT